MTNELRKESPEYVRLSLAAAMTLRLASGRFYRNAKLYCLNLLLTYSNGCMGRCSYCGLSKERQQDYEEKSFIRVLWPIYKTSTILERLNYAPHLERVCISMITNKRANEDTIKITKIFKEKTGLLISILISPTIVDYEGLKEFKKAGCEMVGIAIDTASKEQFIKHRPTHKWKMYWDVFKDAIEIFGRDKVSSHLIVGLGEREDEMVETIQKIKDLGGRTHLFSFYPEQGSSLEKNPPCDISSFRRIQIARYLIDNKLEMKIKFNKDGKIIDFGRELEEIINSGKPFQTSGCGGKTLDVACNRPFGDGPPRDIRSFPFKLNKLDIKRVKKQLYQNIVTTLNLQEVNLS